MDGQKRKVIYGLCYCVSAILMAFYPLTLWQGLHPQTSVEYRMYYLEETLRVWPGENGLAAAPGETLSFQGQQAGDGQIAGHLAAAGWHYAEEQGYQMDGNDASLYLVWESDSEVQGQLCLDAESACTVNVLANGEPAASVQVPSGAQTVPFEISGIPSGGLVELSIAITAGEAGCVQLRELVLC